MHDLHPRRPARAAARGRRSSRATASCTSRPVRTTCRRRRWPTSSTSSPPACSTHIAAGPGVDVVHGNYWLSGVVGHRLKHELDVPLVSTFHTLARVKAEGGDLEPAWRDRAEAEVIGCSDAICVSCPEEERQFRRLYGDPAGRIEIVPPAVEHAFFAPGDRRGARRAVGLPADRPVVLFVGRIQPLKAPDVAIRALAALAGRTTPCW